ncbi:hypothetical protein ACPV3A_29665 [Paenibacillus sp. Dod16]|uniref:hypothetical protein n=1 Tax=Paenibacillus sp. Dod16 TaxID=3416392 RepID=UPI003CF30D82
MNGEMILGYDVEQLRQTLNIKDTHIHYFVLTHYWFKADPYFIAAPYDHKTMNALVAFIQGEASKINETFGLNPEDVTKILKQFYECDELDTDEINQITSKIGMISFLEFFHKIDLVNNWESGDGSNIPSFEREGLKNFIRAIIVEVQSHVD